MPLRVLVTGAGGFIGRVLVARLLAQGLNGQRVGHLIAADMAVQGWEHEARVQAVRGSIADAGVLEQALARWRPSSTWPACPAGRRSKRQTWRGA
jgi:nucleoside-diphosphate-sugar epimerase